MTPTNGRQLGKLKEAAKACYDLSLEHVNRVNYAELRKQMGDVWSIVQQLQPVADRTKPHAVAADAIPASVGGELQAISKSTNGRQIAPTTPLMPQDIEAEKALLGCMLIDVNARKIGLEAVTSFEAFMQPEHRTVYRVLRHLHEEGQPADAITFRDRCARDGIDIKAVELAVELCEAIPSCANVAHYSAIVVRHWRRRQIVQLARRIETETLAADADPGDVVLALQADIDRMRAGTPGSSALQLYTAEQIKNRPRIKWQISGIIPAGSLTVLYGPSGGNKTFVALDWAACIATGSRWADHHVEAGRAVYVAAEGSGGLGKRVRAWEGERGVTADQLFFVCQTVPLLGPSDAAPLLAAMKPIDPPPSAVFVDTMARSIPGADENSAKDVGGFIAAIDRIRQELGCAVVVVHHTGKNPDAAERGSSALRGAADTMIRVLPDGDMFILSCEKQKDAGPFPDLYFARETVDCGDAEKSCIIRTVTPSDSTWTTAMSAAWDTVALLSPGETLSCSAWLRAAGLPDKTFYRARKALIAQDYIKETQRGKSKRYAPNPEKLSRCQSAVNAAVTVCPGTTVTQSPPPGGDSDSKGEELFDDTKARNGELGPVTADIPPVDEPEPVGAEGGDEWTA